MAERDRGTNDTYTRESFTFRRMTRGQVWAMTVVVLVLAGGVILYAVL